jgi:hypothetical protein
MAELDGETDGLLKLKNSTAHEPSTVSMSLAQ